MLTLEEMLADTQLTDDIKIPLPGGKEVTVGALRAYATSQREVSAKAQREYEVKQREADAVKAKAERLATDSLALYDEAEKMKREAPAPRQGDIDWENDPVYSPINKRLLKELEAVTAVNDRIKKLEVAFGAAAGFVTDDYYERRWNAIPKDQRPKDKTWRDYLPIAHEQKIMDSYGLADPIEAYNKSTAADREEARLKAARAEGAKEERERQRQASLPRPGGTPQVSRPADAPKFNSLRDAMAAAASDPEILRVAAGTSE